jgi:CRP-like cAMP-binding protein
MGTEVPTFLRFALALEGAPPAAISQIVAAIDRQTAAQEGWTFVMISAEQFGAVVEWLARNSARPMLAVRLWTLLLQHLCRDTCEIGLDRAGLAEQLGCTPQHVSSIITELEGIGAVQRRVGKREAGRRGAAPMRYFLNPRVGTHLTGAAREKAQAEAPLLRVVE